MTSIYTAPPSARPTFSRELAFTGVALLGAGAQAGLFLSRRDRILPCWFASTLVAASLTAAILVTWTANLGGMVRHTELRPNSTLPTVSNEKNHE